MVLVEIILFICNIQTAFYNIMEGVSIDSFTLLDIEVAMMLLGQTIWFLNEILGTGTLADPQKKEEGKE